MINPRYQITHLPDLPPIPCPCGQSRRAFVDDADQLISMHLVEISADSQTHYHQRTTEVYYVLEGAGQIELDGELFSLAAGDSVLIKPGCRHRAIPTERGVLRILISAVPAFDPADEFLD